MTLNHMYGRQERGTCAVGCGGRSGCVTVYSVSNLHFLCWTRIKTQSSLHPHQNLRQLHLVQLSHEYIFHFISVKWDKYLLSQALAVTGRIVGDKQKIKSPRRVSLRMSLTEFTERMNDKYLSGTWHAFLLNDRPAQEKPLSPSCTLASDVLRV